MTLDVKTLYQQVVMDHNTKPRNFGSLDDPDFVARGENPLCGDEVEVAVKWDGDRLVDIAFQGQGCAICIASASMMTQAVRSRDWSDVSRTAQAFHRLLTLSDPPSDDVALLGKLRVFEGVRRFPARVKCAGLPWHTLKACLERQEDVVQTE